MKMRAGSFIVVVECQDEIMMMERIWCSVVGAIDGVIVSVLGMMSLPIEIFSVSLACKNYRDVY